MRRMLTVTALAAGTLLTIIPGTAHAAGLKEVRATVETPALYDDEAGGDANADDPAIWVNPADRGASLVIATAKNGGLRVYDLKGRERQAIATPPDGRFNNVDLIGDLVVVTDRGLDKLRFYRVDAKRGRLVDVTATDVPLAFSADQAEVEDQRTAYGLGLFRDTDGTIYAVVSRRSTPEVGLFKILVSKDQVSYRKVDALTLPSTFTLPNRTTWSPCNDPGDGPQVEGTVIDPTTRIAYLAQEKVGLWKIPVWGGKFRGSAQSVERVKEFGIPATYDAEEEDCVVDYAADPGFGGRIAADVEGLTIYQTGPLSGTLLVSSQGDSTFYTYDRLTNRPLGHLAVVAGKKIDGAEHCDGAAVVSTPLPGYPNGLLVVHDGEETPTDPERETTNFKFLDAGIVFNRR
ncbi:phytase [Dactylosporangium sp. AC04546]|uniref:phytase n=1 Tax=Dactylosporangium sp. AC04546 TaxID=2862460 RepID=UPI001EE149EE|nr:phytase [Dactylosporangium sp. AC04546]WVK83670.1 phytase [Dactylosporangium sp. AC04546]